jgi:hypothetical protein
LHPFLEETVRNETRKRQQKHTPVIKLLPLFITLLLPNIQTQSSAQPSIILFERLFSNPKNGFQIRGEIIDGYGRVHSFNNRNDKPGLKYRDWNLGKKAAKPFCWEMTPSEIERNLNMTDSVVGAVKADTLSKYLHLLHSFAESNRNFESTLVVCGTSFERDNAACTTSLYGFVYDSEKNIYKRIWIENHSNIEWENQSETVDAFRQWKW